MVVKVMSVTCGCDVRGSSLCKSGGMLTILNGVIDLHQNLRRCHLTSLQTSESVTML